MTARGNPGSDIVEWILFPKGKRTILLQQAVLAGLVVAAVCVMGPWNALIGAATLGMVAVLFVAPTRLVLLVYVAFMGFTHQFRSFFTLNAAGIEWHPRELLLFALLAHGAVRLLQGRGRPVYDPIHLFISVMGLYFVQIAIVGLLREYNLHLVIAEVRPPLTLASYGVLVLLATKADLPIYTRAFLAMTTAVACAAIGYFLYTFVTGHVINTQGVWGEYVPRVIGSRLIQSVRPPGHMYYEVCLVVLASFAMSPLLSSRARIVFLSGMALLAVAIAITFMRTAYVSAAVSLAILAVLALPSWQTRAAIAGLTVFAVAGAALLLAGPVGGMVAESIPTLGTSIRGRVVEIEGAYRVFRQHPGFGAGMGSTFEAIGLVSKTSQLAYVQISYQTVHNTWMYYLFKGGILGGLLIGTGLFGVFVEMCRRMSKLEDWRDRFLLRGLAAAYGGQMVACLAMPRLLYPQGYAFVAMSAAFVVLLTRKAETPP